MQQEKDILPIGAVVQDHYLVVKLLGRGGFGTVYQVRDQHSTGGLFALKEVIDPRKQGRDRLHHECQLLMPLHHHALPRVYQVFDDDKLKRTYMLMEYIEGPDLEILRLQQPEKRFSLPQVMTMLAPIIEAVDYLHGQHPPIVHRDIKPTNIIMPEPRDKAVLVDFGLAKEHDPEATTAALRHCSQGYAAPEQYLTGTDTHTDIYGLGATMYTLLTGVVPADALHRMMQLGSQGTDSLELVNQLVPDIPAPIASVIHRALCIRSEDRFERVDEFWKELNDSLGLQRSSARNTLPFPLSHRIRATATRATENIASVFSQTQLKVSHSKRKSLFLIVALTLLFCLGLGIGFQPYVVGRPHSSSAMSVQSYHGKTPPNKAPPTLPKATVIPLAASPTPRATVLYPTSTPIPTSTQSTSHHKKHGNKQKGGNSGHDG